MKNSARINNYYNCIEARKDWDKLANRAHELGLSDVVRKLHPPTDAGWRTVDKQIAKLRAAIEKEKPT